MGGSESKETIRADVSYVEPIKYKQNTQDDIMKIKGGFKSKPIKSKSKTKPKNDIRIR